MRSHAAGPSWHFSHRRALCAARFVRRAFLWGIDTYTDQNYDHRKAWVEQRILLLSNAFAVSLLSYAVMSNHLHVVIANQPAAATAWSELEIAERWIRIYPPKYAKDAPANKNV